MEGHPNRIVVPQRPIQGGFDFKFESDPYDVKLYGLLTPEQYTQAIDALNYQLRPSRSGSLDGALLASSMLLVVPLMVWGVRHKNQTKRRKSLLKKAIDEFNAANPTLLMRWNRRPDSMLTIERRQQQESTTSPEGMAHAELVTDLVVRTGVPSTSTLPQQRTTSTAQPSAPTSSSAGAVLV